MKNELLLLWQILPLETLNTLYMVFLAAFFGVLFGLPIGIFLAISGKYKLVHRPKTRSCLSFFVNAARSFPFAILLVALIPFTKWIIGTSLGTTAAIVPLSVASIFFLARAFESALQEVNFELVKSLRSFAPTTWQIVSKILLPEALPGLIRAVSNALVLLIGYSAMAGLVGGGGLGKVAIQYGYYRFYPLVMIVTVVVLIILVETLQLFSHYLEKKVYKSR